MKRTNALFVPGTVIFLVGMLCAAFGAYKVLNNGILDPSIAAGPFTVAAFCVAMGIGLTVLGRIQAVREQIREEEAFQASRSPFCPWMARIDLPEAEQETAEPEIIINVVEEETP